MFAFTKLMQAMVASGTVSDPYFYLTTLLLNTNTTNGAQNNTFIDSSSNAYSITRAPATGPNAPTQGTFTPFSQTGWSSSFNTSTTYLTVTDTTNLRFGSGNFTIEAWVYRNAAGAIQTIASKGASTPTGWVFQISAGDKLVFIDTSTSITGATSLAANTWYYVAVVRAGTGAGQTTLYVNGASDNTGMSATTFNQTTNMLIGADRSTTNFANGYISNLRLSNTNRTISSTPTTALTADANTIFLSLGFNRFQYTDSTAAYTNMTVTGTPSAQAFSPFAPTAAYDSTVVGGSGYFDGTGDYLTIADATPLQFASGTFTINCWVYRSVAGVVHTIAAKGGASTGWLFQINASNQLVFTDTTTAVATSTATIPAGSWTYVSVVRSGTGAGQTAIYINAGSSVTGISATNFNQTTALIIGADRATTPANNFNGYIAGFEYIKGSAITPALPTAPPTTTNSPSLLLNFTNAGIFDSTAKNNLETVGTAQVSTTQAKFGTTSMSFSGTSGNRFQSPLSQNYAFLTGDFTIEAFVYLNAVSATPSTVVGTWLGTSSFGWLLQLNSTTLTFAWGTSGGSSTSYSPSSTFTTGTWYYLAVTRSGTNLKLFVNGSQVGTTQTNSANITCTTALWVGANQDGNIQYLNGYVDELRITKGFARTITATPTEAFPVQ